MHSPLHEFSGYRTPKWRPRYFPFPQRAPLRSVRNAKHLFLSFCFLFLIGYNPIQCIASASVFVLVLCLCPLTPHSTLHTPHLTLSFLLASRLYYRHFFRAQRTAFRLPHFKVHVPKRRRLMRQYVLAAAAIHYDSCPAPYNSVVL